MTGGRGLVEKSAGSTGAWRQILLNRLLVATAPIGTCALVMAVFASEWPRVLTGVLGPPIALLWVMAARRHLPFGLRAGVLIGTFVLAAILTYGLAAFAGNASLLTAFAIITTGLLFGRRPLMAVVIETNPPSRVLVVSGHVQEELTRRGIEQGRFRLLRKPFKPEDLCEAVDEVLRGNGA